MELRVDIPKALLVVLNQLYDMEQKLKRVNDSNGLTRNIGKMKDAFAEEGLALPGGSRIRLMYEDPLGKPFNETRTDLEMTIAGPGADDLVVVEVIKPIIRASLKEGISFVVQKGVVIAESQTRQ
ncbi:hypothetical protein BH10PLA2_BH10PLA2_35030 [soil metagenome]